MDVVTIGESMAVFSPESSPLMRYAATYSRKFGGAESNVAIGLTRLGHDVGWISKVGNDELGKGLLSFIRGEGVDVSQVKIEHSAPTGLYFKEVRSASNVRVEYYRKGSAASKLTIEDLNEAYIAKAKYIHVTGITPALSESCYETIIHMIKVARENEVKVIFDPNLRKKLWSEERAREVLLEIAAQSDIVMPGVSEGEFMFGETDPEKLGELFLNHGASLVVIKVGAKGAYYFTKEESKLVPGFPVEQVVDPVGAGDGFAAGVISGLLDQLPLTRAVERGNAVGAMATQIPGDFEGLPTREEIEQFMNSSDSEDINR
ncbi:sugar kinase [Halalkalibacter akibai]|uniref:2-dehydro-3-deoxygluconate kinase n=1 Tax=Halalkalibacter akibai (strain ATCC 43226 / DSM 21942 / CIP 109018 / JCM 9157 / 1139) TaxID=1236973 RepID=W4QRR0_HALA3|nr:sugar kinase [Halalkalibacter akibai]GAE34795.1 2-dehydro-3-deoxygluconate kinase [Halalkalibacter akibai JCM 9157]